MITNEMIEKRNEYLVVLTDATGIPMDDIMGKKRNDDISMARQLLMWALYALYGYTTIDIGKLIHRHHTTVTYAVKLVNTGHLPERMEKAKQSIITHYKSKTCSK